ncbi:MAG: hypothetical protein ACK5AO_10055 [bacterium]
MITTETVPQQTEHFEWLSAVGFYNSYLDIIGDRLEALTCLDGHLFDERKANLFQEKLQELRDNLSLISYAVNEHIDEVEMASSVENRLEMDLQCMHHTGLREKFEQFETQVNDFRSAFNEFYVRLL